jgi:RNA polymerase sigma factor for flagellar operon FliA
MLARSRADAYAKAAPVRTVEGLNRDEVCRKYQDKVFLVARRIHERLSRHASIEIDDLVSWGAIGLLEAFDRFDASKGVRFSTYAEHRIRGTIYDQLRARDTSTRRRRDLAKRIEAAKVKLQRQLGREPLPEEIAVGLEISLDDYWHAVHKTAPTTHVSVDAPDEETGRPLLEVLADHEDTGVEQRMVVDQVRLVLRQAIQDLPERHRHCVMMYYDKEMSLAEIAAVYDVSVSRISQIISDARGRLRKALTDQVELADLGL